MVKFVDPIPVDPPGNDLDENAVPIQQDAPKPLPPVKQPPPAKQTQGVAMMEERKADRRSNLQNRASDRHIALRLNGNRFAANALPRVNQNKNAHSLKWLRPLSAPKAWPNMFHDTFDLAKLPSMPNNWDRT